MIREFSKTQRVFQKMADVTYVVSLKSIKSPSAEEVEIFKARSSHRPTVEWKENSDIKITIARETIVDDWSTIIFMGQKVDGRLFRVSVSVKK